MAPRQWGSIAEKLAKQCFQKKMKKNFNNATSSSDSKGTVEEKLAPELEMKKGGGR